MAPGSDPPSWAPPSASARAQALWKQSPFQRFYDLVHLTDQKADEYTALLFESFSVDEIQAAVVRMVDIRPLVREKAMLDEFVIGNLAKSVIRAQWSKIDVRLRNPGWILSTLKRTDPTKAAVLDTPRGHVWLNWTCYELQGLLGYVARPKNYRPMAPPPGNNPLIPIPQQALTDGRQA